MKILLLVISWILQAIGIYFLYQKVIERILLNSIEKKDIKRGYHYEIYFELGSGFRFMRTSFETHIPYDAHTSFGWSGLLLPDCVVVPEKFEL